LSSTGKLPASPGSGPESIVSNNRSEPIGGRSKTSTQLHNAPHGVPVTPFNLPVASVLPSESLTMIIGTFFCSFLESLTDDIWDKTFDVNLRGLFYGVRAATPLLRKQPGAAIVKVASVAGSTGVGSSMACAAAKGGVITMTKSLARVLAPEVRVNAISPGLIRTHFAGRSDSDLDFTAEEVATPLNRLPTVVRRSDAFSGLHSRRCERPNHPRRWRIVCPWPNSLEKPTNLHLTGQECLNPAHGPNCIS
jgi:NAD(P)-dependent dehydrogenase (short-subunit alcohol dehydrogenase family)